MKAIVPVKSSSVRVPGKNFRLFHGVPLYQVILSTLNRCAEIEEIVVDTDAPELIEISAGLKDKLKVMKRPEHLVGDDISVNFLISHNIDLIEGEDFLQTHCTNPLLSSETIADAIDFYKSNLDKYDSIFSVTPLQTRLYDHNFSPINHNPQELMKTQDLKPVFEENSNLYIFSRTSFKKNGSNRIGQRPGLYKMNRLEAIDIDTEEEFLMTESLWGKLR